MSAGNVSSKHRACPFCGGNVDPAGWLNGEGERGPECETCGATAPSIQRWNTRVADEPDESPKAPWLTTAHLLCSDAGIPHGHINDRLLALRARFERHSEPPAAGLSSVRIAELQAKCIFHAETGDDESAAFYGDLASILQRISQPTGVSISEGDARYVVNVLRGAMTMSADAEAVWRRIDAARAAVTKEGGK